MLAKLKESASSVLPLALVIVVVCFTAAPVSTDLMLAFIIGTVMLILGMGFFTLGAETSMTPIGTRIGTALTKSRRLGLILVVSFLLGAAITVAEPDLQVLAENVPHINSYVLILTVGVGVGFFLAVCMLRILLGIRLRWLLLVFYAVIFTLAAFADNELLGVAFDSGGVTTGPMTVPFILALGVGVANIRSDKKAEADSFGLVALCSIGPIMSVLILGFFYRGSGEVTHGVMGSWANTVELSGSYLKAIPPYMLEMAIALAPIVVIFLVFQLIVFKLDRRAFIKIIVGVVYTYVGLVLFLTGVNVGFSQLGTMLGHTLTSGWRLWLLLPLSMLLGWFIISAEPAVYVLEKQVEEISSGAIPGKAIKLSLSIAIALATGLSVLRIIFSIPVMWFLIPGYAVSLLLTFFVPDIFTAIAFDSGGVASGPMTATFMLPFAIGISQALGGNILTDAFGLIAMVAMMPLITIQLLGVIFSAKSRRLESAETKYGDDDIIELWG